MIKNTSKYIVIKEDTFGHYVCMDGNHMSFTPSIRLMTTFSDIEEAENLIKTKGRKGYNFEIIEVEIGIFNISNVIKRIEKSINS